jgi:hypothetical protein
MLSLIVWPLFSEDSLSADFRTNCDGNYNRLSVTMFMIGLERKLDPEGPSEVDT